MNKVKISLEYELEDGIDYDQKSIIMKMFDLVEYLPYVRPFSNVGIDVQQLEQNIN